MKRNLNKAVAQQVTALSPVWIVPAVALLIALWLAVQARMERGTIIEITFDDATDIIAGQTQIKLNEVKVGVVQTVKLSRDLKHVRVTAELDSDIAPHLSKNTRFWMVTPRISAAGVSNLGTLISGVYIVMDPGAASAHKTKFEGLSEPPVFESDEPGTQYLLQAEELGSIDIGSPIYFRQIRVGEVTGYKLAGSMDHVDINFFIRAPYDEMVQTRSRFWNVSGFGVSINADGMRARMESLASLINGGVAFDNTAGFENVQLAESGHRFFLYSDRESVLEGRFNIKYYYRLKFTGTVRGLTVGAPVEFRGIKVGEVVDVELASAENVEESLHVFIAMEPERLQPDDSPSREEVDNRMESMVEQGLRAQMKTASLITGSKYIDLTFVDNPLPVAFVRAENYSEIPTVMDKIDQVGQQASDLLAKINNIPFETIGFELAGSLESLNVLLTRLEQRDTGAKLDSTLASAENALQQMTVAMTSLDHAVAPDSELKYEMTEMAKSLSDAARSLELFLNELNRHPNSLLLGKDKDE
ncbi:PqiB family protein [Teredinibacter purpureus]|uniref:PqiB family protein n=1 Tax=Teredinibacter purpureus TaxID=2731756 RepID=UPI0005F7FA4E|nr:MlaD family protein [Teredinibacter purpureus]